ncbi:Nse4 protein [Ancylostoma duodenale]|uniref:Non-structural maintenance of chromosomes element 4 n=1 Tax=Ancylostoma duodenale TaxID=51022 RepID=A0A0C2H4U2_9BILA|nr:Nse4 protein [Ancylostoma duodenale]
MTRPLRDNNSNDDESEEEAEDGLTRAQLEEATLLSSQAAVDDPSEHFARRASIRETYKDICSQFEGESATDAKENAELIVNLGKSLDDVDRSYRSVGAGGKELAADADTLLSMAKVLMSQMQSFQSTNAERTVTAASFADALFLIVKDLRSIVSEDCIAPSSVKPKKERIKRGKDEKEAAVVLTNRQTQNADDEVSVALELDKVRKSLKRAWKETPSVDFYSFVIDATDFAKTVENMFYVSFLVKDGRVRLAVGETGLPVLLHVSSEERERLHVDDRSVAETHQAIFSFNYDMWEAMVEALNTANAASSQNAQST